MTIREALEKANAVIARSIEDVLQNEVLEAVKEEEIDIIHEVVYGVYPDPVKYIRRFDNGGLVADENIKGEVSEESVKGGARFRLSVRNITEPNPYGEPQSAVTVDKRLDELIEYGYRGKGISGRYDFPRRGRAYLKKRPFTAKTIERLANNKAHVKALKKGLELHGFTVK